MSHTLRKSFVSSLFQVTLLVAALSSNSLRAAPEDDAVAARSAASDLAGAFTANDGYKLRDGFFTTRLKSGETKLFSVNLYSGNSYWFCMGTMPAAKKVEVIVFDETGKPMPIQPFTDGPRAAAGFTAANSGIYYIRMSVAVGNDAEPSTACLLYAYK